MIKEKKMDKSGAKALMDAIAKANTGNVKKSTPKKDNKKKK